MEERFNSQSVRKMLKLAAACVAYTGLWLLLLFMSGNFLKDSGVRDAILPAALLAGVIPFVTLAAIVISKRLFLAISFLLSVIALTAFPLNFYGLISVSVIFLGLWRAVARTKFELANNVKFTPSKIVSRVASVVLVAYLLAISVQVYSQIADRIAYDELGFYQPIAGGVTARALPIIERQLPGFHATSTLDEYLVESLRNSQPQNIQSVPQADIDQSRAELLERLGISVSGQDPVADVIRSAIAIKLQELSAPYRQFLPALYTLAIFSLLRLAGYVVTAVSLLWGAAVFWLLRMTKFLKVTTAQIMAEHVEI